MSYGIQEIGNWQLQTKGLLLAPEIAAEELYAAMVEADQYMEREVKDRMPAATGLSRASIFSAEEKLPGGAIGVVGSSFAHIAYVELGTQPHFPPLEPLEDWVRVKFSPPEEQVRGIAFAIARKISLKGTEGVHMFRDAFAAGQPTLDRIFERAGERVVRRMANGGRV